MKFLFVIVLVLSVFNVGVFGAILELGLTIAKRRCQNQCVAENHNDPSYFNESGLDLRGLSCVCRSSAVNQCRATCVAKYNNNQAYQKSYIENGYCLCKKY